MDVEPNQTDMIYIYLHRLSLGKDSGEKMKKLI